MTRRERPARTLRPAAVAAPAAASVAAATDRPVPAWAWAGVAVVAVSALPAAVLESLLVPLYVGGTPIGLAVALAVIGNVALPLLARSFVPRLAAVALPFVVWIAVVIAFGVITRPEGDVILPGGSLTWVSYGVLLGGALAGMATVVMASPARAGRR